MSKKPKSATFQVLLLENDKSQDVEVRESEQVDFSVIKRHLKAGGSVFITSKSMQKIIFPKKAQLNYSASRKSLGTIFRQNLR
jgi:hypothetical protein